MNLLVGTSPSFNITFCIFAYVCGTFAPSASSCVPFCRRLSCAPRGTAAPIMASATTYAAASRGVGVGAVIPRHGAFEGFHSLLCLLDAVFITGGVYSA